MKMSDEGKVVTRTGIGGPVVKEAIAVGPATAWCVMKRERGVWTQIGQPHGTEDEAVLAASAAKSKDGSVEYMVMQKV
jgi:hypothetical protein